MIRPVHLVPTGNTSEVVEAYDTERCVCGGLLAHPHVRVGHLPCSCAPGGHRTRLCMDCGAVTYEPPHDETIKPTMASLYDE